MTRASRDEDSVATQSGRQRSEPAGRRLALRVLVAAAGLWLGWEIVSGTVADTNAADQSETALAWAGNHSAALVSLAENQLDAADEDGEVDTDAVAEMAERALSADPVQEGALRVLALAADAAGDGDRAETAMELAGKRSLRDLEAQAWLFNRRLLDEDYPAALSHADAVLRVWPEVSDIFLPVLVGLANDVDGEAPLVTLLKQDPSWRGWFLGSLPGETSNPAALQTFYTELRAGAHPLTAEEFRPYLMRLVDVGDYARAYALQVDFLPDERIAGIGLLNNGEFDEPISGLPFDWSIGRVRGARTEVVVDEDSDRALRVEFHNTQVPYRHVRQMLLLRPGSYRFSGEVKAVNLENERGLQWVVRCVGGEKQQLAATQRVNGSRPWTTFIQPFEVPDERDCEAQELWLVLPARIAAERQVSGEIWYDSLLVERDAGD